MTRLFLILILSFQLFSANGQQENLSTRSVNVSLIHVNNVLDAEANYSSEELVRQVLFTSCANLNNFSEIAQGTATDTYSKSYGFFKRTAGSTFPFESGVILSTGKAYRAANTTIASVLSDNLSYAQPEADADLENALSLSSNSTKDRTVIEFDFVPSQNSFSFNFLMVSEEYHGDSPCNYFDGFAFLLKPVGGASYTNLAVIPGTTIPISCETVHSNLQHDGTAMSCGAANETYFDSYNSGNTNFNGRTAVFTASSVVVAGQAYHIKLVVADHSNALYDSAVFLEAGSFDIGSIDIKDDSGTIFTSTVDLCSADVFPNLNVDSVVGATYQWQLYNTVTAVFENIAGATTTAYLPTQDGTYNINVSLGTGCVSSDEVTITHHQTPIANYVSNLLFCDANNDGIKEHINLTNQNTNILNGQDPTLFEIRYFESSAAYTANTPIATANDYTNTTNYNQTIIAEIRNINNHTCLDTVTFSIHIYDNPTPSHTIPAIRECDNTSFGTDTDGINTFDLTQQETIILNGQSTADFAVHYYTNNTFATEITNPIAYQNATALQTIYVKVENIHNSGCSATTSFEIEVFAMPTINTLVTLKKCDTDADGVFEFNLTDANTLISANAVNETFTYYESLSDATANNNAIADPLHYTSVDTHSLWVTVATNNACQRIAQIDLTVSATIIPATFYRDFSICDEDTIPTDGMSVFNFSSVTNAILNEFSATQQGFITVSYYPSQTDALAQTNEITNPSNYINTTAFNQDIWVRISNSLDTSCTSVETYISLHVSPAPSAHAVNPFSTCDTDYDAIYTFDTSTLEATVLGSQTGMTITYFEADGLTPLTNNSGALITSPFPADFETTTKDIIVVVNNPLSPTCSAQTTIAFVVNPKPYFEVTTPQAICLGVPITIVAENPSAMYNYQWLEGGVLLATTPDLLVTGAGDYTVIATDTATNCTTTATIHVDESSIANFAMDDIIITENPTNNTVTILTDNLGVGDYQFSMDNGAYQDSSVFSNVSPGIHTVTADDKLNCGTVSLTISIIGFPKFFTPNNDGYHDTWQGIGLNLQPNSKIYIYDRFAKLIYVQNPLSLGWDGTYNGKKSPATDYWYKAVLEDSQVIYGHFALKR
jgi:gliding motility-associated-like protein